MCAALFGQLRVLRVRLDLKLVHGHVTAKFGDLGHLGCFFVGFL